MKGTIRFLLLCLTVSCGEKPSQAPAPPAAAGPHPTVEWILACRAPAGGFGWYPGDSAFSSTTGMALEALRDLGALDRVEDTENLVAWLRARQQLDGGFIEKADYYGRSSDLPWGSQSALEPTYWALRALSLLNASPADPEAAARFIAARQMEDGAFDASEYAGRAVEVATYSTYWAVAALKELGRPVPDSAKVVAWLGDQQNTIAARGGFTLSPDGFRFSSVPGTGYAVAALALLGAGPDRPAEVKHFLLSSYGQEAEGGFELGHGDNWNNYDHYSRTVDTYHAVNALSLIGLPLSDTDTSRASRPASDCAAWLASVENPDGGFARFGVNEQVRVLPPGEMQATWQAVRTFTLLGQPVPRPASPMPPQEKIAVPADMRYRHPAIDFDDPADIWAYRRIALPVYEQALAQTGSRVEAVGMLSRWARAAVGPENEASDRKVEGRRKLAHGWGQCGTMSWLVQALAASVDYPARGAYVSADANAEALVKEDWWDKPHWVCYIPFTNEWIDPQLETPEGTRDGWSALDLAINLHLRTRDYNYISLTHLGDEHYWRVWVELIDAENGRWGDDVKIDTSMTYTGEVPEKVYPGGSW
ncbi:MAG: prenyltransferase/squalene oxidase repeat-containing protein [Candidatus Glassbacteria bacterium]